MDPGRVRPGLAHRAPPGRLHADDPRPSADRALPRFGALAAALIGTAEYYLHTDKLTTFTMAALSLEVILGFLTTTGSLMAFGKLQDLLPSRPLVYRGQNVVNLSLFAVAIGVAVYLVLNPARSELFPVVAALSLLFGVLLIIPIGGADMPTVISLLNSYAGLSASDVETRTVVDG